MAFRQISMCLPAWLSAEIGKMAEADQGLGQVVVREVVPTSSGEQAAPVNPANGRPIVTAQTKRRPTSAVAIGLVLVVDNGDRPGRREETAPGRSIAQARRGSLASNSLRLVR